MRKFLLVANPASGKRAKQPLVDQALQFLESHGVPHQAFETLPNAGASVQAMKALLQADAFTDVLAIGGDGTLNQVANALANRQEALSVVTAGTGNDFAKAIGVHAHTLEEQLQCSMESPAMSVDLGLCNGRYFINTMGFGFDGEVVADMVQDGKRFTGHLAYLSTVLKHLAFYREQEAEISIDGEAPFSMPLFLLAINNGQIYGGGFQIAPKARLADGLLDCCIIGRLSLFERFQHLPKVQHGEHLSLNMVKYRQGRHFSMSVARPMLAHIDGELFEASTFQVKVAPHALRVRGLF